MTDITLSPPLVAGCSGKFPFANANRAWKVAKRMTRRDSGKGQMPATAYLCRGCGRWHVGHKDRR